MNNTCRVCGVGDVVVRQTMEEREHRGRIMEVPFSYYDCGYCGCEYTDSDLSEINTRALGKFFKQAELESKQPLEHGCVQIDIDRMKMALNSGNIKVPPGLSREQLIELINAVSQL